MPRRNLTLDPCVRCGRELDMTCPLVLSLSMPFWHSAKMRVM
jgi:hypothetical protein